MDYYGVEIFSLYGYSEGKSQPNFRYLEFFLVKRSNKNDLINCPWKKECPPIEVILVAWMPREVYGVEADAISGQYISIFLFS